MKRTKQNASSRRASSGPSTKKTTSKPAKNKLASTVRMRSKIVRESAESDSAGLAAESVERKSYVPIGEQDVILLQTTNLLGMSGLQDLVFGAFAASSGSRRSGVEWLAFAASDMPHHAGRTSWLGFSKSVPSGLLDAIQAVMQSAGLEVEREMGRALHLEMNPFARLSDAGLEILVPAALAGNPDTRRVIERGGASAVARGYVIQPSKTASLQRLFFGSGD